jgi:hypothetical protein
VRAFPASRLALALAAALAALATAADAGANGRFPTAQQVAVPPNDPSMLVLMATFGVSFSYDKGSTWSWVCEGAVGYMSNENPILGVTEDDSILVGTFEGLGITTDRGCTWTLPTRPMGGVPVTDLVVEVSDPHSAFVLTSGYAGIDDAGSTFNSAIWFTHDDGTTFNQVGSNIDPEVLPETIEVAPSNAAYVYISGTRRINGVATGVLLYSTNGGQTFTQTLIPFASTDRAPFIAAVDPTNPLRVYVRVQTADALIDGGLGSATYPAGSRVLVSNDGLQTVQQVWQAPNSDLLGFVVSPDGTKVYTGGPKDGLHVASSTALDFTAQASPVQIECLAFRGTTLLACSQEVSGFTVGSTTDDGATWTPLLHLSCIQGPLNCGSASLVASQCDTLWATQQETLGGPDPACTADAGAPASDDAGTPATKAGSGSKSGGCALSASQATATTTGIVPLVGVLVGVAGAVARRRRRARRGKT